MNQSDEKPESNIQPSAAEIFDTWLDRFGAAVETRDAKGLAALAADDASWRDILSFTWARKIFAGPAEIEAAFDLLSKGAGAGNVRLAKGRTAPRFGRRSGRAVVEGWFDFDTAVGRGAGFVRLLHDPANPYHPKIWLLLTTLHELEGFAERVGKNRPSGEEFSKIRHPESWLQIRELERSYADRDPEVIIIGAGQSGLILAARLRQMGVDVLAVENAPRVGDNWRNRYNNLTLHNKLGANHFPYLPFPTTWPTWLPKDMLGDWLEAYAKFLELNVWTETSLDSASYDDAAGEWSVSLTTPEGVRAMRCKHLVVATGVSGGVPKKPKFQGIEEFDGAVVHSGEFRSGMDWAGKRAVVIGTGNSGHDIAQDLYVSGAEAVSIMQRGPTCVLSLEPSAVISYSVYSDDMPVEDVDLMVAALPYNMIVDSYRHITRKTAELDKKLIEGLNQAGFRTHQGEDDTGFQLLYLRGAGGYYIDVGCSELIIDGKIGVLRAEDMERFEKGGIRFKDGRLVPCDVVVTATGFESMQENIRRLLGDTVADRVGKIWGFDEDQNVRNMWMRTKQPGLWLMGGAILEARLNSRYLALEIKASLEGLLPEPEDMPLARGLVAA